MVSLVFFFIFFPLNLRCNFVTSDVCFVLFFEEKREKNSAGLVLFGDFHLDFIFVPK